MQIIPEGHWKVSFTDIWEKEHGIEPGLPGHSYTPRQLFWIAAAQVMIIL